MMNPQRQVYFAINSLGSGGAEKQLLILSKFLAEQGFKVTLIALESRSTSAAIRSLIDKCIASQVKILTPKTEGKASQLRHLASSCRLLLRTQNCVIWSWGSRADFLCKLLARPNSGNKLICSLRLASEEAIKRKASVSRWRSNYVDLYISNSALNNHLFNRYVNPPHAEFEVIPNAVEIPLDANLALEDRQQNELLRVCLLGNNRMWHKGYDILLDVAKLVQDGGHAIHFSIAGRDYDGNLGTLIERKGLGKSVSYVGEVSKPIEYLRGFDTYLLTSRVEGTPNALLEAMSTGLPSVATRVGDLASTFVDAVDLRLVGIESPNEILETLVDMKANWARTCIMARTGQRKVQEMFSEEAVKRQLLCIFETRFPEHTRA